MTIVRALRYISTANVLLAFSASAGYTAEQSTSGQSPTATVSTLSRPSIIYITDFHLEPYQIEKKGPLGRERKGILGEGLSRLRDGDPEEKTKELNRILVDSIIEYLKGKGLRAEYLKNVKTKYMPDQANGKIYFSPAISLLPKEGWLVTGWFEKVQEGDDALKATVGFGAGTGKAEADITVSDLAHDPDRPFLVMGSGSRTRRMPGGLVTKNSYVIAAKFVMDRRHGTEKDIKSLGAEIAKSLIQYIQHGPGEPQQNVPASR